MSQGESLLAASNIFLGQTEAPLLAKPFLKHLTLSEIHAVPWLFHVLSLTHRIGVAGTAPTRFQLRF